MTTRIPKTALMACRQVSRAVKLDRQYEAWSLTHAVEAAVRNVDKRSLSPLRTEGENGNDAKRLLALLAWSYARQVYSSAEIHAQLHSLGAIDCWEGGAPEEWVIRRFRDENRFVLQLCLRAALRFQAAQKVAEGVITRINEALVAEEAMRRLIMAMFIDNLEQTPLS